LLLKIKKFRGKGAQTTIVCLEKINWVGGSLMTGQKVSNHETPNSPGKTGQRIALFKTKGDKTNSQKPKKRPEPRRKRGKANKSEITAQKRTRAGNIHCVQGETHVLGGFSDSAAYHQLRTNGGAKPWFFRLKEKENPWKRI